MRNLDPHRLFMLDRLTDGALCSEGDQLNLSVIFGPDSPDDDMYPASSGQLISTPCRKSVLPCSIHKAAPKLLALLDRHHAFPLVDIDGIDIPAWLDAES